MNVYSAGVSDIGRVRATNQDAIYLNKKENVFLVADGMGGHSGGEMASTMAIKFIAEFFKKYQIDDPNAVKRAISEANNKIKKFADNDKSLHGMGTTVITLNFHEEHAYIGCVGDSRAYLVNRDQLFQLTKDHSMVQEKINLGVYSREEAAADPHKNVLSRTVGYDDAVEIDAFKYKCKKGDLFLLCSDGLHGKVSDEDIIHIIKNNLDLENLSDVSVRNTVQELVTQAYENGGQDNISVLVVAVQ